MASFGGHTLPGTFFIIFALWNILRATLIQFTAGGKARFARLDGIIILSLVGVGCFVELFWPFNGNHPPYGNLHDPTDHDKFYKPMNWQHFTMYLFFGLYGFFRLALSCAPDLLKGVDRLAGGLAFFIEGFLFYNHVHGRSPLDQKIHLLIVLACFSSALVWFLSFFLSDKRRLFILDVFNSALMFAQGTWFWHVAIILYGKHPWAKDVIEAEEHHDDHEDMDMHNGGHMEMDQEHVDTMFAVIFFAWHVVFALVLMIFLSFVIYSILARRGKVHSDFDQSDARDKNENETRKYFRLDYQEAKMDDTSPLLEENVLFEK